MNVKQERPWFKKKKIIIPLVLFVFLVALRLILQPVLLTQINRKLETVNPMFTFHVGDLGIHILKGAVSLEDITGKVKKEKRAFLSVRRVDASIAWASLLEGKLVTEIEIEGADLSYTKKLLDAAKALPKKSDAEKKEDEKEMKEKISRFRLDRVALKDSKVTLDDYPGLEEGKKLQITGIEGAVTNIVSTKANPLSFFNVRANIAHDTVAKATGELNLQESPLQWDVDSQMQGFDLSSINKFLKRKVPLTFTKGKLDFYAEAKSQKGKVEGYVKPFLKDIDVVKSNEDFKGPKHWLIEVVTAMGNLVMRAEDKKSVATRIPFSMDKKGVHVDTGEALEKAIEHGYEEKLSPGIEGKFDLK